MVATVASSINTTKSLSSAGFGNTSSSGFGCKMLPTFVKMPAWYDEVALSCECDQTPIRKRSNCAWEEKYGNKKSAIKNKNFLIVRCLC